MASIKSIPSAVMQSKVFQCFTSRELFALRAVCCDWSDQIKGVWCQVVKEEMLEQVHSLDLLYEKETTGKLLEFKLKYLVSYAQLMRNYFLHMSFPEIVEELKGKEDLRARQLVVIAANVVAPNVRAYPETPDQMTEADFTFAEEFLASEDFKGRF